MTPVPSNVSGNAENGLPWLTPAVKLGVPAVIALGLVWWLAQTIGPAVHRIEGKLDAHVLTQGTLKDQNEIIIRILRANCVNQAVTRDDRDRCIQ